MKVRIGKRDVGEGEPCWIVAEMSANHQKDFNKAVDIIQAAAESGADAVKLQTYTADTITIDCRDELFQIGRDSTWAGRNLYDLYNEAYTPWEWHPALKQTAEEKGLAFFSSPFDRSAVDFLEDLSVPAFKIASFELVDLPLIRYAARKGKPMILSTGMASLDEIEEAVECVRSTGNEQIILLKCVSAYPAPPEEMNLRTMLDLQERFACPVGFSDHTLGHEVALAAVSLGAKVIEKHFTLSRKDGGPDASFSMEPEEFANMVRCIRMVESALGTVSYELTDRECVNKQFRRSLFVVKDVREGETFTRESIRSIRPSAGLPPKYYSEIVNKRATCDIKAGSPLAWHHIDTNHYGRDMAREANEKAIIHERAVDADCLDQRILKNKQHQKVDLVDWIFDRIHLAPGDQVLELCSGTGNQTLRMMESVGEQGSVVATDISEKALAQLKEKVIVEYQTCLTTVTSSMDGLQTALEESGLKNHQFDMVFCAYGLYYSENPEQVLEDSLKRIKADGRIVIVGPFGPNNGQLFGFLERSGVKIPDYVRYTSQDFMERVVVPFACRHFTKNLIHILVNPIYWKSPEDVMNYWINTTFFDEERKLDIEKKLKSLFQANNHFINEKWIMMIEMISSH